MNINNGVKRWEVAAFVRTCWTKTETMKESNKRKSFVEPVGMNGSNFETETLFVSFTATITTRNGWDGTNFYIGNWMVSSFCILLCIVNHLLLFLLTDWLILWLFLLYKFIRFFIYFLFLWRRDTARNVRLYYPYREYTNLSILNSNNFTWFLLDCNWDATPVSNPCHL